MSLALHPAVAKLELPAPWSDEQEQATVAAVLLAPEWLSVFVGEIGLTAEDFYLERHQALWRAMVAVADEGGTIDLRTIQAKLEDAGTFEMTGGLAYLAATDIYLPDLGRAEAYAREVKKLSLTRQMVLVLERATLDAYSRDFAGTLERTQAELLAIAEGTPSARGEGLVDVKELDIIDPDPALRTPGITVGLPDLDRVTNGWQRGEYGILAGRPGTGKSSAALAMISRACEDGQSCALYSIEMTPTQCFDRIIGSLAGAQHISNSFAEISQSSIQGLRLNDDQHRSWEAVRQHIERKWCLSVDQCSRVSASYIEAGVRRRIRQSRRPVDLLVIDYVQIMEHGNDPRKPRYLAIGETTMRLKQIAKDLNLAILMVAQLGRSKATTQRPRDEDLRESGNLEQDSALNVLLYREPNEVLEQTDTPPVARFILEAHVTKNRYGRTGVVPLRFDPAWMRLDCFQPSELIEWQTWRQNQ